MCGGDGGFMSIYGGESMAAGTPKDIHFNVELNTDVSKRKVSHDIFNLGNYVLYSIVYYCIYYLTYSGFRKIPSQFET